MEIDRHIEAMRQALRRGTFTSEAAVSQGMILPTLHELGWPVFDTAIVVPQFTVEGRRVDYALCHPANRPAVFVEVKNVGLAEGADRQLFEYAFHLGVQMAVLTDGQEWSFYLPGEQGRYDERRVYQLDLLERDIREAQDRLVRYLSYGAVCSGDAIKAARSDYQDVARHRLIEASLPKAWAALLRERDSLLLDLLAEKVEDLCGYKPDPDVCSQFVEQEEQSGRTIEVPSPARVLPIGRSTPPASGGAASPAREGSGLGFVFKGKPFSAGSAREVMTRVFQILAQEDRGFLERFAARKHGKTRRYLARDRRELYPGRPDLGEEHSVEVVPGWWLGTNYSRKNIREILELALEVAGPQLGSAFRVSVE